MTKNDVSKPVRVGDELSFRSRVNTVFSMINTAIRDLWLVVSEKKKYFTRVLGEKYSESKNVLAENKQLSVSVFLVAVSVFTGAWFMLEASELVFLPVIIAFPTVFLLSIVITVFMSWFLVGGDTGDECDVYYNVELWSDMVLVVLVIIYGVFVLTPLLLLTNEYIGIGLEAPIFEGTNQLPVTLKLFVTVASVTGMIGMYNFKKATVKIVTTNPYCEITKVTLRSSNNANPTSEEQSGEDIFSTGTGATRKKMPINSVSKALNNNRPIGVILDILSPRKKNTKHHNRLPAIPVEKTREKTSRKRSYKLFHRESRKEKRSNEKTKTVECEAGETGNGVCEF